MASFDQGIGALELDNVNEDLFHVEKVIQENVDGRRVPSSENRWPGWPGDSVFRLLVPSFRVGSLIGRKGEFIKKIVEETRARIKVIDSSPGLLERVVMISAKEDPGSPLPPAMDGLFRVHKCVIGLDGPLPADSENRISTKLLVASTQSGCLIGKQGSTVKSIQEESNCLVRILRPEDLPVFAIRDDRVVEVVGEPHGVHKAVELIASHLRKFLVDRSIISVIETQMEANGNQMVEQMPHHQQWGAPQNAPPMLPVHNYGMSPPQYMQPPSRHENFFNPPDYPPPMEKQPHQNASPYGRIGPVGVHSSSNLQPSAPQPIQPMVKQVTQQMQIPLSYADAVIGSGGASISYIRRASGASVTIQETMGVPGEMTVEINGTATQVQTAQQLIQNFMAEASAPPPASAHPPSVGPPMDQGHPSSYQSAQPPPPSAQAIPGYGAPMYGGSYGY